MSRFFRCNYCNYVDDYINSVEHFYQKHHLELSNLLEKSIYITPSNREGNIIVTSDKEDKEI